MHLSLVFDFFSLCLKKFLCFELLRVVSSYEDFIVVVIIIIFFVFLFLLLVIRCWTCYSFPLLFVCFIDVDKVCRLPLSEEPALAMAFSVARRAAAVPLLLVNGTYRKTIRTYLDSSILQYQLQRLNDHGSLKGSLCFLEMLICS